MGLLDGRNVGYASHGVAWTPLDIPGCVLWLDASQITGLNDGDDVSTWPDLSVSANDAAQATAAAKPHYKTNIQNGLPVVRFAETGPSMMQCGAASFSGAGARTILVVYHSTQVGSVDSICGQCASDSANTWCVIQSRTVGATGDPYIAAYANDLSGPAQDNAWKIASMVFDGTTATAFKNGSQTATGDKSAWNTVDNGFRLGHSSTSGNEPMDGDIAEIVVYNTSLSVTDRGILEAYLSAKWNIVLA